jgi:hypothetical protein
VLNHPELSRESHDLDRTTVARIAQNAAHDKLPNIFRAASEAKELKQVAGMAAWAGDKETENAALRALIELAAAATA